MMHDNRVTRAAFLLATVAALAATLGCGVSTGAGTSIAPVPAPPTAPAKNTYLYVAEGNAVESTVGQFHVESDGTLTPLNPPTITAPTEAGTNYLTVDPSGQYLFVDSALEGGTTPLAQFVIGSDGTLSPNANPTVNVTGWPQVVFTPNGKFTFVPDPYDGVITTYGLSSSGTLTQVSQLPVDAIPGYWQPTAIDPSGQFVYFFNMEGEYADDFYYFLTAYRISDDGTLTPLSPNSITMPGFTYSLTVAPNGFLYFPNSSDGTITAFWIDESTGQLENAGKFATGTAPASGPLGISFNPTGTYAYVANSEDNSVTQFTVNSSTGALTMNGADVPAELGSGRANVDPTGKFVFVTSDDAISQYTIGTDGRLTPNGTLSLGANSGPSVMAFAQR